MPALNENSLSDLIGILEVAPIATPAVFTRLASVRNLLANVDTVANLVEVLADDTGTVKKFFRPDILIDGEFLENADRDVMNLLIGGVSSNVAGTPVASASQVIANPFTPNLFIPITNQNGDKTIITINSVTGGTDGALTADEDYHLVTDANGIWGIVLNTVAGGLNITTLAQTVTLDYDYTPNATELNVITAETQSPNRVVVRITATVGSLTRVITLSDATFEGVYGLPFLDLVTAGDLSGAQFGFKGAKGSTLTFADQIL